MNDARRAFDRRGVREWLSWANERLMPETARVVREEAETAAREEAERREREAQALREQEVRELQEQKAREDEEARAVTRDAELKRETARELLFNRFADGEIDGDEFAAGLKALDGDDDDTTMDGAEGENDGNADADGDVDLEGRHEHNQAAEVVEDLRGEKRKRAETIEGLRSVSGKVSLSQGYDIPALH